MSRRWPAPGWHWRARRVPLRHVLVSETAIVGVVIAAALATPALKRALPAGPWRMIAVVGGCATLAVGWRILVALWFRRRERAAEVLAREAAAVADVDGERRGVLDRSVPRGAGTFLGLALAAAGGVLFVLAMDPGNATAFLLAGALALPALVVLVRFAWQGPIEVRWRTATLVPGGRATFYVGTPEGGQRLRGASFLLRCVALAPPRRVPDPRLPTVAWSATRVAPAGRAPGPEDLLEVTFDLPRDALPSALASAEPVWWELLVRGRTHWGTVVESFLVPVGPSPPAGE